MGKRIIKANKKRRKAKEYGGISFKPSLVITGAGPQENMAPTMAKSPRVRLDILNYYTL